MQKYRLLSSVLAFGLLISSGTGLMNLTKAHNPLAVQTAHAATKERTAVRVTLEDADVEVSEDGLITKFDNPKKARQLLDGGELYIPTKLESMIIKGIGLYDIHANGTFSKKALSNNANGYEGKGITRLTFESPNNITYIGYEAFYQQQISTLNLPAVEKIESEAFAQNNINNLELPEVKVIHERAFGNNNIKHVDLPEVETLRNDALSENLIEELDFNNSLPSLKKLYVGAFARNKIHSISMTNKTQFYGGGWDESTFTNQSIDRNIVADLNGKITFDRLQPSFKTDGVEQITNFSVKNIETQNEFVELTETALTNINQASPIKLSLKTDINILPGAASREYSINEYHLTAHKYFPTPQPPVITEPEDNANGSGSTNPNNNNDNSNSNTDSSTTTASHPHTVYATRAMRLHKNGSLTSPVKAYKKQSRAKAANFKVLGVAYDKNGTKRYKVKGGYITASKKYVADAHFRSSKVKQVRVLGNRVYSNTNVNLANKNRVRVYNKGAKFKVKRIVKHGL